MASYSAAPHQQRGPPGEGGSGGSLFHAVEVLSIDPSVSLAELRALFGQQEPVLQIIGCLSSGDEQKGLALVVFASARAAAAACELLDGWPLAGSYLRVRPAESLPSDLVNLLYSLEQVRAPGRAGWVRWGRRTAGRRSPTPDTFAPLPPSLAPAAYHRRCLRLVACHAR